MNVLFFYLVYVTLLSFSFIKKRSNILLFFSLIPFWFLGSFRHLSIGNDSMEYARVFETIGQGSWEGYKERYELGFLFLNRLLNLVSKNYILLFAVCMFIVIIALYIYLKEFSSLWGFSIAMFFLLRYFDMSMNVIRLSVSIAFVMLSIVALKKSRMILFFVGIATAFLFHRTAIVAISFIFIYKRRIKLSFLSISMLSTLVILFNLFFVKILVILLEIFPIYSYYIDSEYLNGNVRIASVLKIILFTFIFSVSIYLERKNRKTETNSLHISNENYNKKIFNLDDFCFNSGLIGIVVLLLSLQFNLFDRISDFFLINLIVYLPNQLAKIKNTKKIIFYMYLFLAFFMLYYLIIIIFKPEWNKVYPYLFYWN